MASSGNPLFDDKASERIAGMSEDLVHFLMRHDGARTSEVCAALTWVAVGGLAEGAKDAETFDEAVQRLHNTIDLFALAKRKNMEQSDRAAD